jgi:hypothetical protein
MILLVCPLSAIVHITDSLLRLQGRALSHKRTAESESGGVGTHEKHAEAVVSPWICELGEELQTPR